MEIAQSSHKLSQETVERLRHISKMSTQQWMDTLQLSWWEYCQFKAGLRDLEDVSIEALARFIGVPEEQLAQNAIDFKSVTLQFDDHNAEIPDKYLHAALGRRRSTINALDFIERRAGWRARQDVLEKFHIPQHSLLDPFAPINVQLMTDLCLHLSRRHFSNADLVLMGADTYESNKESLVGQLLRSCRTSAEAFELFIGDLMKLFEQNCDYRIAKMTNDKVVITVQSKRDVSLELKVREIGNEKLCFYKLGMASCVPRFIGLPSAQVRKTSCVHHGDGFCTYEVELPPSETNH